jgi:hypothetical protein
MQQSTIIGGSIAAAFLAYLAMQGRLGTYWALMTGGAGTGSSAPPIPSSSTAPGNASIASGGNIFGTSRVPLYFPSILGGGPIPGTYSTFGNPAPGMGTTGVMR